MNLLAHACLSFEHPDILAGNMISDFVKGKKQYDYPPMIQKGIRLHRSIDEYTDSHSATAEIKKFFRPVYRLYSGAITDIVYDYFLANDSKEFKDPGTLEKFTLNTYALLEPNLSLLPLAFIRLFPHMKQHNWLYNYRHELGIMKSINGLAARARYMAEPAEAYSIFRNNIPQIQLFYEDFFPMLKIHARDTMKDLLNKD